MVFRRGGGEPVAGQVPPSGQLSHNAQQVVHRRLAGLDAVAPDVDVPRVLQGGFQRLLSADKVTEKLQRWIEHHGSTRLTIGTVEEGGDFTIRAEITTVDGSLVSRLLVDRRDGSIWQID